MTVARQLELPAQRRRIADRYRFQQIQYVQNAVYMHFRSQRPVLADLAATLAVLVYWKYDGFKEYQGALADHVTRICNPVNRKGEPVTYSKKQITDALKDLEHMGYIIIPRKLTRQSIDEKHSKTIIFKPSYAELLINPKPKPVPNSENFEPSEEIPNLTEPKPLAPEIFEYLTSNESPMEVIEGGDPSSLSHISPPLRSQETYKEPISNNYNNTLVTTCNNINNNRAFEIYNNKETTKPRDEVIENHTEKKYSRTRTEPQKIIASVQPKRPQKKQKALKKDLNRVHKQIIHWLAGCSLLTGEEEAIILTARFLEMANDERLQYWIQRWSKFFKKDTSEKSWAVRQIIVLLRDMKPVQTDTAGETPNTPPPPPTLPPDFDVERFQKAIEMKDFSYKGRGAGFVKRFHNSDATYQKMMLGQLSQRLKNGTLAEFLDSIDTNE